LRPEIVPESNFTGRGSWATKAGRAAQASINKDTQAHCHLRGRKQGMIIM
jgi:hypothetical protein